MSLFKKLFGTREAPKELSQTSKTLETLGTLENVQGLGRRERQEDSFCIVNAFDELAAAERGLFAVVADGMGGMENGKQASELAVEGFQRLFHGMDAGADISAQLSAGVLAINDRIFTELSGRSGTTAVAVHIRDGRLHWLSVGDSAIFLRRDGGVFQLNREHNYINRLWLEELGRDGVDRSRVENSPDAARLTSFLGMDEPPELDISRRALPLLPGDSVLLCSDGISGVLSTAELNECMSLPPEEACGLMESLILEKDLPGQDNYTGVFILFGG